MALEYNLENDLIEYAEATGWLTRKIQYVQRNGARDRDFYGYGHKLLIECKRSDGKGALRVAQKKERERLAAHGVIVHVIDNVAAGRALLDKARTSPISTL